MKSLYAFWKKDFINKLIILVLILLLAGAGAFIYVIFNPPGEKSVQGMFSQFYITATPTLDMDAAFTNMAKTKIVEQTPAYLRGAATITPAGVQPTGSPATPITAEATQTPTPSSTGMQLQITSTGTLTAPIATPGDQSMAGLTCIPAGTAQAGRVMDIIDGTTIKVNVAGLFYTVRYIGVDLPTEQGYIEAASMINGQLVFGKDVLLYAEVNENSAYSRLLRYVVVDDKLVNLELIQKGLVSVVDVPPGFACGQVFRDAEQAAKSANLGQWHK